MVSIPHARDFAAKLGHVGAFDRRAVIGKLARRVEKLLH